MCTYKDNNKKGFTLLELVFVAGILALVLTSMLKLFIYTSNQAEIAGNKTIAMANAQDKIEEIRNYTFDNILTDYADGGSQDDDFALVGVEGRGKIYLNFDTSVNWDTDELITIEVAISWKDKYGRVIGEDTNIDGVMTTGEDVNSNGKFDSPTTLVGMITRR